MTEERDSHDVLRRLVESWNTGSTESMAAKPLPTKSAVKQWATLPGPVGAAVVASMQANGVTQLEWRSWRIGTYGAPAMTVGGIVGALVSLIAIMVALPTPAEPTAPLSAVVSATVGAMIWASVGYLFSRATEHAWIKQNHLCSDTKKGPHVRTLRRALKRAIRKEKRRKVQESKAHELAAEILKESGLKPDVLAQQAAGGLSEPEDSEEIEESTAPPTPPVPQGAAQ